MYIPVFLNGFKKDYKLAEKRGLDKNAIDFVLKELIKGSILRKYNNFYENRVS